MTIFHHIVLFVLLVVCTQGENDLHAHGPFGKAHRKTEMPNPFNCNRTIGFLARLIRSVSVADLQLSATNYSNGDHIKVSWTPSTTPCADDFIGVYFTEIPIETGACQYVDFEFIKPGQNNATWVMVNLRRQLEFRYYSRDSNCLGNYAIIAKSSMVEPVNYNEPTQVHLAYGNQNDQMYVSYVTDSDQITPQCEYGFDSSKLEFKVDGNSVTYQASDMCEGHANISGPQTFINPGYMHTMLLGDLRSSTVYFYRVGNDEHGWSPIYKFINRPSSADIEVNLIAYGDMGVSPIQSGARATIDRVLAKVISKNVVGILHIGDVSYARGIGALWDAFMTQIESTTTRVPYMVGIGNHEYDHVEGGEKDPSGAPGEGGFRPEWGDYGHDSGGECAVPMVNRFHSPSNGNSLFWYSFDVGPIHVTYFSTEHDFLNTSIQYAWLEEDLRIVDRTRTPWIIVGSHRPMYSSQRPDDKIQKMLQLHIEPLLYKYHVDLNLFAHIHSYERSCSMYQEKCVNDGVTHVLIGMGGHDLSFINFTRQDWSIYHDITFGYTHIWANKTQLIFSYYHTQDDQLADQFYLKK